MASLATVTLPRDSRGMTDRSAFQLQQNFPNPFNPMTTISYELPIDSHVKLTVFDVLGREVAVLVDAVQVAGNYHMGYDASKLPSGMYFYHLDAGSLRKRVKCYRSSSGFLQPS